MAAATAKPRSAPTSTTTHALSDIGPRFSCPLTLARVVKRRGEATPSRFSPAVVSPAYRRGRSATSGYRRAEEQGCGRQLPQGFRAGSPGKTRRNRNRRRN
jgi:hypothetical protein